MENHVIKKMYPKRYKAVQELGRHRPACGQAYQIPAGQRFQDRSIRISGVTAKCWKLYMFL